MSGVCATRGALLWRGFPQLLLCLSTRSVSSFSTIQTPQSRGVAIAIAPPSSASFPTTTGKSFSFHSTSLHASAGAEVDRTSNAPILEFVSLLPSPEDYNSTVVIGKKSSLGDLLMSKLMEPLGLKGGDDNSSSNDPIVETILKSISKKKGGSSSTYLSNADKVHKLSIGGLPSELSRHNHPMAVHSLARLVGSLVGSSSKGINTRVVVLTDDHPIGPLAMAIAKAFPVFSRKSKKESSSSNDDDIDDDVAFDNEKRTISIVFCKSDGTLVDSSAELKAARVAAAGVQLAARLVDSHPALLTTSQYAKEVQTLVDDYNTNSADDKPKVQMNQIEGTDLKSYGGLYGVGQAARCSPRM